MLEGGREIDKLLIPLLLAGSVSHIYKTFHANILQRINQPKWRLVGEIKRVAIAPMWFLLPFSSEA